MDLKLFFATFITIFLAEMGDKTQFAALAAGAQSKSMFTVWLAVVGALSLAGTLGVVFGSVIGDLVAPELLQYVSGGLFIAVGLWVIFGS